MVYISKKQGIYETHGQEKARDIKMAICEEIEVAMRVNHPAVTELVLKRGSYYLAERLIDNYKRFYDRAKAMNVTFKDVPLRKLYGPIINLLPEETDTTTPDNIIVCSIDSIKGQEGSNCLFTLIIFIPSMPRFATICVGYAFLPIGLPWHTKSTRIIF